MTDYRTASGNLKASTIKALRWYAIEHGLKFELSTPPIYRFTDNHGRRDEAHIDDIIAAYQRFRELNHGTRKASA